MIDFESAPSSSSGRPPIVLPLSAPRSPRDPSAGPPGYVQALNDRQREAVLITEGPLIVLAGAGSGKTKMLTSRIAYLIESLGVPSYQVLAVTFTNKAAAEMRERVERVLTQAARDEAGGGHALATPEIGTFHSVCVRLLRRELASTPFTKPFVIYDDSDQQSLIKGILKKLDIDEKAMSPKSVQAAINRLKCDAVEPGEIEPSPYNVFEKRLKGVYEQYQKDLFANNALDFGEIICMTYRLLRDVPAVREKYQRRFRYIHVDEYQDTNRSQYLLLSMLANPSQGGHGNICVVGDEDQSIYKWRGADIRNILDFEKDYPGSQVVKLEQNYRSTKTIITAASQVIRNNQSRKDKTLWTENEDGLPISRVQLADERAEAELAVSEVKRLAHHEGRAFADFAIFYRTNAQSRQFEDVLRREKIPYQILGGLRFYDRKEIKDVLAYFKVVLNPTDSVNLKRIINSPARGIGKTTLDRLEELHVSLEGKARAPGELAPSYWDAVKAAAEDPSITSAGTARKLQGFVKLVERLEEARPKLLLSELYHLVLDETAYVAELRKEATEESLARIENLEEFDNLLKEFEESHAELTEPAEKRAELLPTFIEQSSLASEGDALDSLSGSVKLMTLHSSKGLEFPVVFLVGMEEGLFPSIKTWEETPEEDIEEERRLCYVGMTRARELLYLLHVSVRRCWGNVTYQEPSRFFVEMPDHLVTFRDLSRPAQGPSYSSSYSSTTGVGGRSYSSSSSSSLSPSSSPSPVRPVAGYSSGPGSGFTAGGANPSLVGRKLAHPEYGRGTILAVEGAESDRRVLIEFAGRQQKKFLWRYVAGYLEG